VCVGGGGGGGLHVHALTHEHIHTYTVIFFSERIFHHRHTMPNMKIGKTRKSHDGKSSIIRI
jgi:hypothetical protein